MILLIFSLIYLIILHTRVMHSFNKYELFNWYNGSEI